MTYIPAHEIKPSKDYPLQEIIDGELIPGVNGYAAIYNLVTLTKPSKKAKTGLKRILNKITNHTGIRASHAGNPWSKVCGKITVRGSDIIIFRKLNDLL